MRGPPAPCSDSYLPFWGLRKLFGLKPTTGISFQLLTLGVLYRFCVAIQVSVFPLYEKMWYSLRKFIFLRKERAAVQWETCSERETEAAGALAGRPAASGQCGGLVRRPRNGKNRVCPRHGRRDGPFGRSIEPDLRVGARIWGHAASRAFRYVPCERVGGSRLHRFL